MTQAPRFDAWLDRFFAAVHRHRPVDATFIGIHAHDDRLPDMSAEASRDRLRELANLIEDFDRLPPEPLDAARTTDHTLARGELEIRVWEEASGHGPSGNPTLYGGQAVFGLIALMRHPFAPVGDRLTSMLGRLRAMPDLLAAGQSNLESAPEPWRRQALRECSAARTLLSEGIPLFCKESEAALPEPGVLNAALAAVERFHAFLEGDLAKRTSADVAAGAGALALVYRRAHLVAMTPDEVEALAWRRLADARTRLEAGAAELGAAPWQQALAGLAGVGPSADAFVQRHYDFFDAQRRHVEEHRLVSWPDNPLEFVETPGWLAGAGRDVLLYPYHAPPAFDSLPTIRLLLPRVPAGSRAERDVFLAANNDSVIKLNHVVHHGGLGHHVQNWYAYHAAESRIGQMAAVDSAGYVVMHCAETMAEGWATYVADLMDETGFLTPLESLSLVAGEVRAAARAIVDVRLHQGEWSYDEALAFLSTEGEMSPAGAGRDVLRMSLRPGVGSAYLLGHDQIRALRAEVVDARGGVSLRDFHDRLLAHGSVPISIARDSMVGGTPAASLISTGPT